MIAAIAFLALAQATPQIQTTDIKVGKGLTLEAGDVATVLYKGTLDDGTVFDESKNKPPFAFKLGAKQVIEGWDKGMQGMKVGGKRKLVIPPSLGYGDKERPGIPANSRLNFEVELLRVDKKDVPQKSEITDLGIGKGDAVTLESTVVINYRGTFLNGQLFDESKKGEPATFSMKHVVKGFAEGLMGMKPGGRRRLVLPYGMGYGEAGIEGVIPRYATLVFEVELLKTEKG